MPLVDLRHGSTAVRLNGHSAALRMVQWSPTNSNMLASAGTDCKVLLWDVRHTQSPLLHLANPNIKEDCIQRQPNAHKVTVNGLKFSRDGQHIISYGHDEHLHVWSTNSGQLLVSNTQPLENCHKGHLEMGVSPRASPGLVFVPSGNLVHTIDITSGVTKKQLSGHFAPVLSVLYNPIFEELYTAGEDREIHVWIPHQEQDEARALMQEPS